MLITNFEPSSLLKSTDSTPEPLIPNMTTYPTPPSSSGDSPQPIYFIASPNSNSFTSPDMQPYNMSHSHVTSDIDMKNLTTIKRPCLRFIEQPTNKFRFRYKSEMAGTHGSLCGMNSDKTRKQTYPTVELLHCSEKAVIRCSIYQYNVKSNMKPHPHRLIMKRGREEFDDPHDVLVGPEEGFIATFHSMGIIHTARKNIVAELVRKKSQLKIEFNARLEGNIRDLTAKELLEIKTLAEEESKTINLNIVCLRFDAFIIKNGLRIPICEPIFSHGINNLKCALTGDLKIVRMDHCTSPAKGNKEIFLLVERVTKKNIGIRFFELDDKDQEVWEGWGKFSELDVHHQYAIVFKTPPYERDPNITSPVRVFMELVRPSDNARSEVKEFRYVPNNEFKPGQKRPRSSFCSSSTSYNSSSINSNEIPVTVNLVAPSYTDLNNSSWNAPILTEDQMAVALNDMGSDEFQVLFEAFEKEIPLDISSHVRDSPLEISRQLRGVHISNMMLNRKQGSSTALKTEVSKQDEAFATRTYNELKSFIKSKDAHKRAPEILRHYLGEPQRTNALHVSVALNQAEAVTFILKMIVLSKQFELTNVLNADYLTPLHIAVTCNNYEFVAYLLRCEADPRIPDKSGNSSLHLAVENMSKPNILEALLSVKHSKQLVDLENYEGETPLYISIEKKNMAAFRVLCRSGANINKKHKKNGFTPLRVAVENQNADMVRYILEHPKFDVSVQSDFQNISPFQVAKMKPLESELEDVISKFMIDKEIAIEVKKEIEEDEEASDEEMKEEEIDIKPEIVMSPTCENPESLYEGVTGFTPQCLEEVASMLDESGKYYHLADLLDLSHLLHTGIISNDQSVSKSLLLYAIEKDSVKIVDIRNFLENLDEHGAVTAMDNMAKIFKNM